LPFLLLAILNFQEGAVIMSSNITKLDFSERPIVFRTNPVGKRCALPFPFIFAAMKKFQKTLLEL